jgi:hypothetical protein
MACATQRPRKKRTQRLGKKNSAVEGFPSRDDRAMPSLGDRHHDDVTDTPTGAVDATNRTRRRN